MSHLTSATSRLARVPAPEEVAAMLEGLRADGWDIACLLLGRRHRGHPDQPDATAWVVVPLDPGAPPPALTARETEVLDLVAAGLTNKEIARRLGFTVHTANRHVSSILRRLGVRNRAHAAHLHAVLPRA